MKRSGFTIIEMLVVVIIVAILSGLVFKMVGAGGSSSDRAKARRQVEALANACEEFRAEYGHYPPVAKCYDKELKKMIQPVDYSFPGRYWGGTPEQAKSLANRMKAYSRTELEEYNVQNQKEAHVFKFGLLSYLMPRVEGHAEYAPKEIFTASSQVPADQHHWLSQNSSDYNNINSKTLNDWNKSGRITRGSDWDSSKNSCAVDNPRDLRVAKKIAPLLKGITRTDPVAVDSYKNTPVYTNSYVRVIDPWGHSLRYESESGNSFRVWSRGPDGKDGSADDISSGNEN